jgi:hypothetical protein
MTATTADPDRTQPKRRQKRPGGLASPSGSLATTSSSGMTTTTPISMWLPCCSSSSATPPTGLKLATEVDRTGRAVILTTTREHAELKRDQIHAFGADGSMAAQRVPCQLPLSPKPSNASGQWHELAKVGPKKKWPRSVDPGHFHFFRDVPRR